ncbi:barstar family protein [Nocardia sp. NPDC051832]|uniref:barstar family protein n=1 Tax=Nocardia sp. NPDC051832 TaxID=3155673 RepID=UPI00342506BD
METGRAFADRASVNLLDATTGVQIGSYFVNDLRLLTARPSEAGLGLVDLTAQLITDAPSDAAVLWDLVRSGQLDQLDLWRRYDHHAWLEVALNRRCHGPAPLPDKPPGATYVLDATGVNDEGSLYCALGEAVNGPGGYFGWNLDAVDDCLRGRWGAAAPFTLILRNVDPILWERRAFPIFLEILSDHGVGVRL